MHSKIIANLSYMRLCVTAPSSPTPKVSAGYSSVAEISVSMSEALGSIITTGKQVKNKQTKNPLRERELGWRNGYAVKRMYCSSGGPGFNCQQSCQVVQTPAHIGIPTRLAFLSTCTRMFMLHRDIHII